MKNEKNIVKLMDKEKKGGDKQTNKQKINADSQDWGL
jgi:hypothetical protein